MKQITSIFALLLLLVSFFSFGQSITGNMNSNGMNLRFGNVDIFRGEEKVASILTDEFGNFNVKLDTGFYRLEFNYHGHEKLVKTIHVKGDEKDDFSLDEDKTSVESVKERVSKGRSYSGMTGAYEEKAVSYYSMDAISPSPTGSGYMTSERTYYASHSTPKSGALTAAEINDFSKWELWKDIEENQLSSFKIKWDLVLNNRYTVQIKNKDGFPIQGAKVHLLSSSNEKIFSSVSDNTGKAELWGSITSSTENLSASTAEIIYDGKSYKINRLTPFKDGVNMIEIDATCDGYSDVVDIAFVVDATGSMGDEIEYLKEELNHVIYQSKNDFQDLTFNYASVFYRDHGDEYLTRTLDFTDVLSTTVQFISQQRAAGGGDYEEAVEIAMLEALDSLSWSENSRAKILFLVLDAPPHDTPEIKEQLKEIINKAAAKGVRIVPLVASGMRKDGEYLLRTMALATNGTNIFLTDHSGIGGRHLVPETDSMNVESLNQILIRIIETYTFLPNCEEDLNTDKVDEVVRENQVQDFSIDLWPNPTSNILNIKTNQDVENVYITDMTGKILIRIENAKRSREVKIDVSNFSKGIYLVTGEYEGKKFTKKFVKI